MLAAVPSRVLLVADPAWRMRRDDLRDEVVSQVEGLAGAVARCLGSSGMGLHVRRQPGVRHLLVVVAVDGPPSPALDAFGGGWPGRRWEALSVFRDGHNPDDVLPSAKPGCPYSAALRAQLSLLRIPHRSVHFRDDEEGAAAVRAHHEKGYELSPTVLVGGEYLTNPSPRQVREAMTAR